MYSATVNGARAQIYVFYTRKNAQVVTDLQTRCNRVVVKLISYVFVLLVPISLEQVVITLLQGWRRWQTCYKMFQQGCFLLVTCRRHPTLLNNLFRVCWPHQPCYKMATTCYIQICQQLGTSSETLPVDKLWYFYTCNTWRSCRWK